MRSCILLALLGAASAQYQTDRNTSDSFLVVNTTSGTYTGFVSASAPTVNQWLGIPFGASPVGPLRFKAAEKAPYHGARNATAYGNLCVQNSDTTSGVFWTLVPEFQNTEPQSEDCLFLNIWAPRSSAVKKQKVPVLIWVVGGAFQEGGGHAPYQVPDRWIEQTQTHIVVTFKSVRLGLRLVGQHSFTDLN
jgi:carboxylesterase type B